MGENIHKPGSVVDLQTGNTNSDDRGTWDLNDFFEDDFEFLSVEE